MACKPCEGKAKLETVLPGSILNQYGLRRSGQHAVVGWLEWLGYKTTIGHGANARQSWSYCTNKSFQDAAGYAYRVFENQPADAVLGHIEGNPDQQHVIHLRDPFNWLASRTRMKCSPDYVAYCGELWRQYARRILRQGWGGSVWWINFNLWFTEPEYRAAIGERFGLENYDGSPWRGVRDEGGGSSFDGQRFNGRADQMAVLIRWKHYQHDPAYKAFFDDEVVYLSERLFDFPRPW